MILKSETYNFHRLDLTRQAGFIVTIYDEDGLRLAATTPFPTPAELHRIYPPLRSASMRENDMHPHLHQSPLLTPV